MDKEFESNLRFKQVNSKPLDRLNNEETGVKILTAEEGKSACQNYENNRYLIGGDSIKMFQRALIFFAESMKKWNKAAIGKSSLKYTPKD